MTFLFLEQSHDLRDLLEECRKTGHRCLLRSGRRISDLTDGARLLWTAPRISSETARKSPADSDPLWDWPNRALGFPSAPLLSDALFGWRTRLLPEMLGLQESLQQLYRKEQVDWVLTTALSSTLQIAAVAACRQPARAESVLVAHGDGPDIEPAWDLFELFPYHHYFVPNQEFAEYFRQRRSRYLFPVAQVHVGSYRWDRYTRLADRQGRNCPQPEVLRARKPVMVYACGQPEHDVRTLNTFRYPEVWYFHLQKELIHTFASILNYSFVIKLFPGEGKGQTALGRFVRDLRAPNLFISEAPFRDWLPWADRVILDQPSTPMYEAGLAGIPMHLLAHERVSFRPAALLPFSSCVTYFKEPAEAAQRLRRSLGTPLPPPPAIQPEGSGMLETLAGLREPLWNAQTVASSSSIQAA